MTGIRKNKLRFKVEDGDTYELEYDPNTGALILQADVMIATLEVGDHSYGVYAASLSARFS